jgi:DedD protein
MDKALKQRLVGASVIIALAVIILPMLLSGRPQATSQQSQKIELPPRPDELSFETRRFPVSENQGNNPITAEPAESAFSRHQQETSAAASTAQSETEPATGTEPGSEPMAQQPAPMPEPAVQASDETEAPEIAAPVENTTLTEPPVAAQEKPAVSAEPEARKPAPASASGRYVVQVASLGSAENASRLMKSLQEKGYPVLLDTVESGVGRLNRVRVGPYAKEAEASKASNAIGKEFSGVSPRILDLNPEESGPATASSDPLVRWVVQAGSFAESSNAERLVAQLRKEKLSAYSEAVTSSSSTIYRVRVGPFLERDDAIKTKQLMSQSMAIEGVVMSAD